VAFSSQRSKDVDDDTLRPDWLGDMLLAMATPMRCERRPLEHELLMKVGLGFHKLDSPKVLESSYDCNMVKNR